MHDMNLTFKSVRNCTKATRTEDFEIIGGMVATSAVSCTLVLKTMHDEDATLVIRFINVKL
jgi:hypothetical protein